MIDAYNRWCLFYDTDLFSSPLEGPPYKLLELAPLLVDRAKAGESWKLLDGDKRIVRIAGARIETIEGKQCLVFVITMGNRFAATPSFVNFDTGSARDADRKEAEVKGASVHGIIALEPNAGHPSRHLSMIEQSPGIGRQTIERLLNSEFAAIARAREDKFISPKSGKSINVRPLVNLSAYKSGDLENAIENGTFAPIELVDTTPAPSWDETGKFRQKVRLIRVELVAPPGERREALEVLSAKAKAAGYNRLRLNWKAPGTSRAVPGEIATDLADLGEALFAKRELIFVEAGMSECSDKIRDDFVKVMSAKFQL